MSFRKSYEIVGYSGDASVYCITCAKNQFASDPPFENAMMTDREGNNVLPVFLDEADDMTCDQCGAHIDE